MSNDNQKKLKVYLDTSVISYLHQEDAPERMRDTLALWQMFREEKFEVCLSLFTLNELNACYEPKRSLLLERLGEISYEVLPLHQGLSMLAIVLPTVLIEHQEDEEYRLWKK